MVPIIFFNIFLIFSNFLSAKCSPPPLVPALYIFGDSLFDSGNNNLLPTLAKANYFPYGLNFPGSYPTGRFTNGKTVVDFIADYLGLPYPPPRVSLLRPKSFMGYNYASGSCGILPETGKFIVLPGYNPMIGVPPQQHLVGVNNIPPVGHMRGNVIFPQHNYIGAHLHNYQAHQPGKVGVATNLFPLVPVDYRMSMGGIRMSQDVGEAIQRSQNVSGVPMSENVGSLSYFTSNAPTLQGSENQTLTPELVSSQDLSTN